MVRTSGDMPRAGRVLRLQDNSHRSVRFQSIIPRRHQAMQNRVRIGSGARVLPRFQGGSRASWARAGNHDMCRSHHLFQRGENHSASGRRREPISSLGDRRGRRLDRWQLEPGQRGRRRGDCSPAKSRQRGCAQNRIVAGAATRFRMGLDAGWRWPARARGFAGLLAMRRTDRGITRGRQPHA